MIERSCVDDVAFRVITANQQPDHATIARFRQRHEDALAGLFSQVLGLCAKAGMASVGVIAVDGTKLAASASRDVNLDYEQVARKVLEEAAEIDAAEDERYGEKRGDELPETVAKRSGRRAWLKAARQQLERERAANPKPVARSRPKRLREAKRRLEEELAAEVKGNADYEAWRERGVSADGKHNMASGTTKPWTPPELPEGKVNTTDPDSRLLKARRGFVQGYNAQAVVNEHQIVIAAEITTTAADFGQLEPMITAARKRAGRGRHSGTAGGRARGRRLLAQRPDGTDRQRRHRRPHPSRRRPAQRDPARLEPRLPRVHAPRPRDRARRRPLPQTQDDDRARLRPHQVQPPRRPLPTTRQIRRPLRMAPDHRHPQPHEAPTATALPRVPESTWGARNAEDGGPPAGGQFSTGADRRTPPHPFAQQPRVTGTLSSSCAGFATAWIRPASLMCRDHGTRGTDGCQPAATSRRRHGSNVEATDGRRPQECDSIAA